MIYKYKEIGEILRKKRTELGKSITTISEETRVLEKYLQAIEEGDIKEFQSPIYYDLFARSYARELGFDDQELFEKEQEAEPLPVTADSPAAKPMQEKPEPVSPRKSSHRSAIGFGVIIIAAVAVLIFILLKGKTPQEETAGRQNEKAVSVQEPIDTISPPVENTEIDSISPSVVSAPLPTAMRLSLKARQTCWFLIRADGDTVLFGNLAPGDTRNLAAKEKFLISAGNPSGVEFKLDDTLLKPLSPDGKPIRAFEINRENMKSFYFIPEDTTGGRH